MPSPLRFILAGALCAAIAVSATLHAAEVGQQAPAFALLDAQGNLVSLTRLRGHVVHVDFWASWCGPCRRSFPWMNALHSRYGDRGLAIVAINVDKKRVDAERFLQQNPAAFSIVFDAAGVTPSAWGVRAMPSSYLIDQQGKIIATEMGFTEERKGIMEERIRVLLGAP